MTWWMWVIIIFAILVFFGRETEEQKQAKLEKERLEKEEEQKKELLRQQHRDADEQTTPYVYNIGKHGNEALAIRYGIVNEVKEIKEYWYYEKGGERRRNSNRDTVHYQPAKTVRLQKTRKIDNDLYEVLLTDHRNRKALAIIEVGSGYVKTFYPLEKTWFEKHRELENTLKGNGSFTLKELAIFHVQKTVGI